MSRVPGVCAAALVALQVVAGAGAPLPTRPDSLKLAVIGDNGTG